MRWRSCSAPTPRSRPSASRRCAAGSDSTGRSSSNTCTGPARRCAAISARRSGPAVPCIEEIRRACLADLATHLPGARHRRGARGAGRLPDGATARRRGRCRHARGHDRRAHHPVLLARHRHDPALVASCAPSFASLGYVPFCRIRWAICSACCCRPSRWPADPRQSVAPRALGDARRAGAGLHPHGARQGRPERAVLYKHALRNALIPFVTSVGIMTGYLLGGAIVVEQVFAIPGPRPPDPRRHRRAQLSADPGDDPRRHRRLRVRELPRRSALSRDRPPREGYDDASAPPPAHCSPSPSRCSRRAAARSPSRP